MSGQGVPTESSLAEQDARDPLADFREAFLLPPQTIYLDGNSLGAAPRVSIEHLREVAEKQWASHLISSWTRHGWIDLPLTTGRKLARLIGAGEDEVVVTDSATVNIFRLLCGVCSMRPERSVILLESDNFPADNYIAQGVRDLLTPRVKLREAPGPQLPEALDDDVAVVLASHVNYRTGRLLDMATLTQAAHDAGALMFWDLCHSAGVIPMDLEGSDVDLAVGCGYKYLNGGPGAPGFLYVARRLQSDLQSPLYGWMGHAEPFQFTHEYRPDPGIRRHQCGTPPILSMAALDAALDVTLQADGPNIRAKSRALTQAFIALVETQCRDHGFELVSPREPDHRGNQVAFSHPNAYPIVQALIARNVIGDFREPDVLRFGFAPLYNRYIDVWNAVVALRAVMENREWNRPEYRHRARVT